MLFVLTCLLLQASFSSSFSINATGGTFPTDFLAEAIISYEFNSNDFVDYFDGGTVTGKCNVMGYWHTGNSNKKSLSPSTSVKLRDTRICTDTCTVTTCGFDSNLIPRPDHAKRLPLVDFAIAEVPYTSTDYSFFPDLQMFPAFAGAAVPIYNIPGLKLNSVTAPIVFSRSTMSAIFLGKVQYWDDPLILATNNNTGVYGVLSQLHKKINVVVRQDTSGVSKIFVQSLMSFDPVTGVHPDYSFANTVGNTLDPTAPKWCDPVTDEISIITVTLCDAISATNSRSLILRVVNPSNVVSTVTCSCNASAADVHAAFTTQAGVNVTVSKTVFAVNNAPTWSFKIGFVDTKLIGGNWFEPQDTNSLATVTVKTLQEGGFWNTHFNPSPYYITQETQTLFLLNDSFCSFTITVEVKPSTFYTTDNLLSSSSDLAASIELQLNLLSPGLAHVTQNLNPTNVNSPWIQCQVLFSNEYGAQFPAGVPIMTVQTNGRSSSFFVTRLLAANNYPRFRDPTYQGVKSGGKYVCYKRSLSYVPFSYYTAASIDLNAEVKGLEYSLGYSTLSDASKDLVSMASLINKGELVVQATSVSVSYAMMEKGGNLDSHLNANLVDGSSLQAWPMSGYNYICLRLNHHIGSCERRKAAMSFIYNFYNSPVTKSIANRLGFASLPDFLRDLIVKELVATVKCSDGSYALEAYMPPIMPIYSTTAFSPKLVTYLSAYSQFSDSNLQMSTFYSSDSLWTSYLGNPDIVTAAFTFFIGYQKALWLSQNQNVISTAFAHVALGMVYRLDTFSSASAKLQVTGEILAGMYDGSIIYWNDTKIQHVNMQYRNLLPYKRIVVAARNVPSDINAHFIRFLAASSPAFCAAYSISVETAPNFIDYSTRLSSDHIFFLADNNELDKIITFNDGSIGYYTLYQSPASAIAGLCRDAQCTGGALYPNEASIQACSQDTSTIINPSLNVNTYDLMASSHPDCYPIVGTLDFSLYSGQSTSCDAKLSLNFDSMLQTRMKFSQWLYNNDKVVNPLKASNIVPTSSDFRSMAHQSICNIQCYNRYLGYQFCNYRDCTWDNTDFIQMTSTCNYKLSTRSISYQLKPTSSCLKENVTSFPSSVSIFCEFTPQASPIGSLCMAIAIIGIICCGSTLVVTIRHKDDKVIKRSQPIFIGIFISGALLMNLSILAFLGPNTSSSCLLRPWAFNLSSTIMFAPLIMKLRRVDAIFHNPTMKKLVITNFQVGCQVALLVLVDIILLILWSSIETPKNISVFNTYASVLAPVSDSVCGNSGLYSSKFEGVVVAYKCLLIAYAIRMSIKCWDVQSDISEAKHFAVAIYNIAVLGAFGYFLGIYLGNTDANIGNLLRCLGISLSSCCAVLLIMVPKFLMMDSCSTNINGSTFQRMFIGTMLKSTNSKSPESSGFASSDPITATTENTVEHALKVKPSHYEMVATSEDLALSKVAIDDMLVVEDSKTTRETLS